MVLPVGLVHYKWGLGSGKTTSIIGLLIRATGQGLRAAMIQFLKCTIECNGSPFSSGEWAYFQSTTSSLNPILIRQFGRTGFILPDEGPHQEDYDLAREGLEFARSLIQSGEYDLIALDEIVDTVYFGLLDITEIVDLIKNKPENLELVIAGHFNYPEIFEIADYVTEFQPMKHPYAQGIIARKGIEY
ncbi:MAG TPA: cob(I)yrinic acid a,c-diamide adenosyltransferase [Candidatus Lokiarchaeia archaeon]|nr:cob(I)yrinic acid a,c-diamide adenosyltransferase [Candidatus Lokiarchaeia archaeon]